MTAPEIRASKRALVERGNVAETPGGAVHRAVWSRAAGVQGPFRQFFFMARPDSPSRTSRAGL